MRKFIGLICVLALCLFSSPVVWAAYVNLFAGQTIDAGDVSITNDGTNVTVTITTEGDWILLETHVAIAQNEAGIPQNKKGNPQVGLFSSSTEHNSFDGDTEAVHTLPLGGLTEEIVVAAHAKVLNTDSAMELVVVSDWETKVTATNTEEITPFDAWELSWLHPLWLSTVDGSFGVDTEYIWEVDGVNDRTVTEDVSFERVFSLPGYPLGGSQLLITCDNQYSVSLNGNAIGNDANWKTVETYDVSGDLVLGSNTLTFHCTNVGAPSATGNQNPAMLIFELNADYSDDEETAWGDGARFVDRGNWATYIEYQIIQLPDLVVTEVIPGNIDNGTLYFSYTVANTGGEGPSGNSIFDVAAYLSADNQLDGSDIELVWGYCVMTYHLDVGWSHTRDDNAPLAQPQVIPPGDYYLIILVDAKPGQPPNFYPGVVESNETNNWKASSTTVTIP